MTPITCAKPSPPRGRSPSFPTTLHVRSNIHSTSISMPSAISWNVAFQNSSSSAASQPASKRPPEITVPSSLSQPSSYGCDKCPHHLAAYFESASGQKKRPQLGGRAEAVGIFSMHVPIRHEPARLDNSPFWGLFQTSQV